MISAAIDGVDVTEYVQETRWRPRWNLPHSASIRVPRDSPVLDVNQELTLEIGTNMVFGGRMWYVEAAGDPDSAYVVGTAWDYTILLRKCMCIQGPYDPDPGNMVDVSPVIEGNVTAPEIAAAFVNNMLATNVGATETPPPGLPLPIVVGTVETGGVDCSSVPMAFPMTVDRMINLLISTGQLIVERVFSTGFITLNFLNPYTNDLSGSVDYEYGTGAFNAQTARHTLDIDELVNALWYLLGRRRSDGRWPGSITPTAPHVGGSWPASLLTRIDDSRDTYGYLPEIQILDDAGDENDIRDMFEERWANEAWVRAMPREFASIMPERGTAPDFALGDTIGVAGGSLLNGGFTGDQRVYGWDLTCDADGVLTWEDIVTSADQEGAVPE